MAEKHPKRPRDLNQWAKQMVDLATGSTTDPNPKDPAAVALGRRGGLKGGKARAANQLVEFFHNAWGRTDIIRSSLSPQLSRLKSDGEISLAGKVWTLNPQKTEAAAE